MPHLLAAQRAVEALPKASRNDFGNYNYTSAEDMITGARLVLHDQGLIITRAGWRLAAPKDCQTGEAMVEAHYILGHESGACVMCTTQYPVCVGKGRPSDKALNASLTTGLSYFLRDLLLIPRCDDEVDQRPDTLARTSGTRPTPTPSTKGGRPNNKRKFMAATARWIGCDIGEQDTTDACLAILKHNGLPTDGSCSPAQFGEMLSWVEEKMSDGVDAGTILASRATT